MTTLASLYSKTNEDASSSLFDILHLRYPDIVGGNSNIQMDIMGEDDEQDFMTTNQIMARALSSRL